MILCVAHVSSKIYEMVVKICEICRCPKKTSEGYYMNRFPLNPDICAKWLKAVGNPRLVNKTARELHQTRYVCQMHFDERDIIYKNTISTFAIPTRNLPQKQQKNVNKGKKMFSKKCIIPWCKSATPKTRMCRWPRTQEISTIWLKILKKHVPNIEHQPHRSLRNNGNVCILHFEEKYFLERRCRSIWAIPMLFTKEEMSTRRRAEKPSFSYCMFNKSPKPDHTYARMLPSNCPLQPTEDTDLPRDKFIEVVADSLYSINNDHDYTSVDISDRKLAFMEGDEEITIRTSIVVPPSTVPQNVVKEYRPSTLEELIDYCDIRSTPPCSPQPAMDINAPDLKPDLDHTSPSPDVMKEHRNIDEKSILQNSSNHSHELDNTLTDNDINSMGFLYWEDNDNEVNDYEENNTAEDSNENLNMKVRYDLELREKPVLGPPCGSLARLANMTMASDRISQTHKEFTRLFISNYQTHEVFDVANATKGCNENVDPLHIDTKREQCENELHVVTKRERFENENRPVKKPPTPRRKVTRTVKRKKLSPAEEEEWREREKEWRRKQNKMLMKQRKRRLKNKLTPRQTFDKLTKKINPLAKEFMWMQIKMAPKLEGKDKGFRFTLQEKLMAQAINEQSPKTYRFLQKIFIMPSQRTLKKMRAKALSDPQFATEILDLLKDDEDETRTELEEAVNQIENVSDIEE